MTEEEQGDFVEQVELGLLYNDLKTRLLAAAEDCEKRGYNRAVTDRFKAAAAVCDLAGDAP
jgi:hypothetical protein